MGSVIEGRERWRAMGKGKMGYFSLGRSFLLIYLSIHGGWFLYSEIERGNDIVFSHYVLQDGEKGREMNREKWVLATHGILGGSIFNRVTDRLP